MLREHGFVQYRPVPGDARQREYLLTVNGEIQLSQHRAFGASESALPDPTPEQTVAYLDAALDTAVMLRRKSNKLLDAVARLRRIITQARKHGAHGIALEATVELATTLRQAHQLEEARAVLADMERISVGQEPNFGVTVVPAAIAHREYTLGWLAERDSGLGIRARHLRFAAEQYEKLVQAPPDGVSARWRERQAWSILGLANNLRAQSLFVHALKTSGDALKLFEELDDDYGRSRCLFTFGFCLRLLGEPDEAWVYLKDAHEIAMERGYERFQADSLMQMGEVRRCTGKLEEASELLKEAHDRAEYMHFTVTQAFALSAVGALRYQRHDLEEADQTLLGAQRLFLESTHVEGSALNARRWATVARRRAMTRPGERERAAALIADAFAFYSQLRCPAGLVASEVEQGQLQILRDGQATEVVGMLIDRLDDPDQRDLLEHDPWVPRVLASFALEVQGEEGELTQRAHRLIDAAQRRARQAKKTIRETVQAIGAAAYRFTEHPTPAFTASAIDEMGGETRHRPLDAKTSELVCM